MPSPSGPEAKTTFAYYGANNPAESGRVETVTDANGHATNFEYDAFDRGLVTKITHADQKYSTADYDNYGRLLWQENELRQRTNYEYDDYGRVTHVKTPLPDNQVADTQYFYEPSPGVSAKVRTAPLITALMRPPASSPLPDPTIVTTYQYDNDLRLKQITQYPAAGSSPTITTLYDYDNEGNLKTITDPRQNTTTIDYDNQNRKWRVTSPWVTGSVPQTTQYITRWKYDVAGNVRRIIQPDATEKVVEYDAMNRVLVDHAPIDPSNAHERTVSYAYYPSGTIQSVTDANHNITSFSYNNRDLRQTIASPAPDVPATYWVYDDVGNLLERPTVGGARQLLTYDNRNRLTQMRWSNGIDSSDFGYDDAGRLTLAQNPNSTVVRRYDEGGRLALETQTFPAEPGAPIPPAQPVSVVSRNYAQGNFDIPLPLVGDEGIECRSGGDNGDYQIVAIFATPVTVNSVTVNSGIAKLVGANLSGTQITIDLTNVSTAQRLTVKLAGLSDGAYSGDLIIPMRVLIGDANGDGVVDDGDSLEITDHANEPLNTAISRYDVDANGVIDNADGEVVKTYSGKGLPLVATGGVSYEYDPDGKINHLYVTGRGYDVSYRYDGMGRLYFIQQNNSGDSYQYSYDDTSNATYRYNNVNDTWVHREFDEIGRVKEESLHANQTSDFSHLHYTYDPMNRLRFTYREEDGLTDSFGYDEVGELTSAQYGMYWNGHELETPASPYMYHFDPAGNRLSVEHGATSDTYVPNHLNQYDYVNNYPVINGSEHEVRQVADASYEYVNDGRLSRVTMGSDTFELGYDALGRRVSSKFNGQITHFIYNGVQTIVEYSADRTPAANTVYGLGIDEIIARNTGGGQFPLQNRLGSTVAVTGGKGTVLEQYRYDAFGTPTIMDGEGNVREKGTQINNRFLFAGREWVPRFGFYEYRARAYHPGLGRFMSEDPLGLVAGDANLFRYCENDPLNKSDPLGLDQHTIVVGAGLGVMFTWGTNNGQANVGLYLGIGLGLSYGYTPSDSDVVFRGVIPAVAGQYTEGVGKWRSVNASVINSTRDGEATFTTGVGVKNHQLQFGVKLDNNGNRSSAPVSYGYLDGMFVGMGATSYGVPAPGGTTTIDPNICPTCATTERVIVRSTYLPEYTPTYIYPGSTYFNSNGSPFHVGSTGNLIGGQAFTVLNWFPGLTSSGGGDWQNVGYFPSRGQPGEGFHPVPWYLE
jgi:RHS repeat-associated protein